MAHLDELFRFLKEQKASDLHLAAGLEPRVRQHGHLEPIAGWPVLTDEVLRTLLMEIASPKQWQHFEDELDLDFAYGLPEVARFRANYFHQENGVGAVFRIIPEKIIPLEALNLPASAAAFADLEQGLVLVTGPTGSGKSTTLASIIDRINTVHARHIVTIEDPIEFVHPNKQCTLSQREVGTDTKSFARALRAAMRQDPNVILVGELRDQETIALAITAAEMGVLVFGTLHTNSASKTIDRVVDVFPPDQQRQVRSMLASSLAGVLSQLLLRTADGQGRVAAVEVLVRTSGLANVIREGNTTMINSIVQNGRKEGMQSMDDSLYLLAKGGRVLGEDAWMKAANKKRFEEFAPQVVG